MKKFIAFISINLVPLIVALILPSCADECEGVGVTYTTTDFQASAKRITNIDFSASLAGSYTVADYTRSNKATRYDSLGIDLSHEIKVISQNDFGMPSMYNYALACSPAVNYDLLRDITITSSQEYTVGYPAGKNLINLLSVRTGYGVLGDNLTSSLIRLEITEQNLFLLFKVPPSTTNTHDFTITYAIGDDYRMITKTVTGVRIKP